MKAIGLVIAVAAVAVLLLMRIVAERRRPHEKQFRCARCSKVAADTTRTINAWRSGKTRFFCAARHSEWLSNQPRQATPRRRGIAWMPLRTGVPCLYSCGAPGALAESCERLEEIMNGRRFWVAPELHR